MPAISCNHRKNNGLSSLPTGEENIINSMCYKFHIFVFAETHAELMDRFDNFEEMFRDFMTDEGRGDENLIRKYEREILLRKKTAKNKLIYSA